MERREQQCSSITSFQQNFRVSNNYNYSNFSPGSQNYHRHHHWFSLTCQIAQQQQIPSTTLSPRFNNLTKYTRNKFLRSDFVRSRAFIILIYPNPHVFLCVWCVFHQPPSFSVTFVERRIVLKPPRKITHQSSRFKISKSPVSLT